MSEFDYIIVGAGSAGCVLAEKLGQDTSKSILVIEAGPLDNHLMIHVPAGVYSAWRNPKLNWNYDTEPESALLQRQVFMPRGKVVGGSSSINSMVYMRGHPCDYDRWSSEQGLQDWSYSDCLPYFKAGEKSDRGADQWRGDSGRLGVTRGSYDNPLYDAFLQAGEEAGQGTSDDLNGFDPEGVSRFDATRWHGRRCSAAVAFLRPAMKRGNVSLVVNAHVMNVEFDGRRATGVRLKHRGQLRSVIAGNDVILSGGAINSPQLLMLSGIGSARHLREMGISPREDRPAVGANLQDHASVILQNACTRKFPVHRVDQPHRKFAAGARWVFSRGGVAASNIWEAGGLIRSSDEVAYPNIQYHFGPVGFAYQGNKISLTQAYSMHIDLLRPRSRGTVKLASKNPFAKPLLNFNYYAHPRDLEDMLQGVQKGRTLFAQSAFDAFRGVSIDPPPSVTETDQLEHWIRSVTETDFHPCGTCRMGVDSDSVVDPEFRVRGFDSLRVVDASVMPRIVSGNLNAPTQMLAARAADYISQTTQLGRIDAEFAFHQ